MVDSRIARNTKLIRTWAVESGFDAVGVSKARFLEEEAQHLEDWLKNGYQAGMSYMENHFDMRLDPRILVPGAKSVITFLYNYFPEEIQPIGTPKLAKYAYGVDYHRVIKSKLKEILSKIKEEIGEVNGRAFVDSGPVMERAWAKESGLGWLGKHSLLLSKKRGSFFFLAELILDIELAYDTPVTDHCGNCRKCVDACPTEAILENGILDAGKCISYLTIELKEEVIPPIFKEKMEGWFFGCDICQDVCPWNRFSKPHRETAFSPADNVLNITSREWLDITKEVFDERFRHSPLFRAGWKGIRRNIKFSDDQSGVLSSFSKAN